MDGTDPRFLALIFAVMNYVEAHSEPKNPFVKGFGISEDEENSYNFMVETLNDCSDLFPEVEDFIGKLNNLMKQMEDAADLAENE